MSTIQCLNVFHAKGKNMSRDVQKHWYAKVNTTVVLDCMLLAKKVKYSWTRTKLDGSVSDWRPSATFLIPFLYGQIPRYTLFSREGYTFKAKDRIYENFEVGPWWSSLSLLTRKSMEHHFQRKAMVAYLKKTTELLGAGFLLPIWLWINTY